MDLLCADLTHYGEIQAVRDANTSLTSAQDALKAELDRCQKQVEELETVHQRYHSMIYLQPQISALLDEI